MELDEVVGHGRHELERPRPLEVARELDARPDGIAWIAGRRAGRGRGRSVAVREVPDAFRERAQERERPEARHGTLGRAGQRRPVVADGQQAEQAGQLGAELGARHDPVDEAVVEQELGALEALGQLLGDRAGRHARAGEADQRVGLRDVHVTDRGERGEHAARRRIGQDRQEGHAAASRRRSSAASVLASCMSASVPSCIRAPPDALTTTSGIRAVERVLGRAGDLLADDRAHRAAHEPEVHDADGDPARHRSRRFPRPPRRACRSPPGRQPAARDTASGRRSQACRPTGGRRRAPPRCPDRGAGRGEPRPTAGNDARSWGTPAWPCRAAC